MWKLWLPTESFDEKNCYSFSSGLLGILHKGIVLSVFACLSVCQMGFEASAFGTTAGNLQDLKEPIH